MPPALVPPARSETPVRSRVYSATSSGSEGMSRLTLNTLPIRHEKYYLDDEMTIFLVSSLPAQLLIVYTLIIEWPMR